MAHFFLSSLIHFEHFLHTANERKEKNVLLLHQFSHGTNIGQAILIISNSQNNICNLSLLHDSLTHSIAASNAHLLAKLLF